MTVSCGGFALSWRYRMEDSFTTMERARPTNGRLPSAANGPLKQREISWCIAWLQPLLYHSPLTGG